VCRFFRLRLSFVQFGKEKRREMVPQQLHVASNDTLPSSFFTQWEPIVTKQQKPLRVLGFSCVLFALPTKKARILCLDSL